MERLIAGRGAGKTYQICERIALETKAGWQCVLIVPSRAPFDWDKNELKRHMGNYWTRVIMVTPRQVLNGSLRGLDRSSTMVFIDDADRMRKREFIDMWHEIGHMGYYVAMISACPP